MHVLHKARHIVHTQHILGVIDTVQESMETKETKKWGQNIIKVMRRDGRENMDLLTNNQFSIWGEMGFWANTWQGTNKKSQMYIMSNGKIVIAQRQLGQVLMDLGYGLIHREYILCKFPGKNPNKVLTVSNDTCIRTGWLLLSYESSEHSLQVQVRMCVYVCGVWCKRQGSVVQNRYQKGINAFNILKSSIYAIQ